MRNFGNATVAGEPDEGVARRDRNGGDAGGAQGAQQAQGGRQLRWHARPVRGAAPDRARDRGRASRGRGRTGIRSSTLHQLSLSFWPSSSVDAAIGDERAAPLLLAAVHRWRLCSSSGFWNLFDVCSLFQSNRSLSESCIKSEWIFSINVCNLKKIQCAADPERLWRTHRGRPRHQTVGRGQRRRRRRRRAPASVGQEAPGGGPRGGHGPAFLLRRPFQQKEARLSRARQKERPHCILGSILCGILCSILIWSAIVCTLYLFLSVTLKEIESHVSIDLDGYEVPFGVYLLLRQPS